MATSVTIRRKVRAGQTDVPELAAFEGKDVEITVTEVAPRRSEPDEFPLRGTLLWFEDPDGPATDEEDWEALR